MAVYQKLPTLYLKMPPIIDAQHLKEFAKNKPIQMCWQPNSKMKKEAKVISFDFSDCTNMSPSGIVYIRMLRDHVKSIGFDTYYRRSQDETINNMMREMNLVQGNEDDIVYSNIKFIYPLHYCNSVRESREAHKEIMDFFLKEFPNMENSLKVSIDYMLTEIRDNAGVHGYKCYNEEEYPLPVYICGAEYNGKIEISIGDRGQGIWKSLTKNNPTFAKNNNKDAVVNALKNGVSGHPDSSPGFGLFSSKELLKNDGTLHIWSSNCYVVSEKGIDKKFSTDFPIGTIVTFVIDKNALVPFDDVFKIINVKKTVESHMDDFFMEV